MNKKIIESSTVNKVSNLGFNQVVFEINNSLEDKTLIHYKHE